MKSSFGFSRHQQQIPQFNESPPCFDGEACNKWHRPRKMDFSPSQKTNTQTYVRGNYNYEVPPVAMQNQGRSLGFHPINRNVVLKASVAAKIPPSVQKGCDTRIFRKRTCFSPIKSFSTEIKSPKSTLKKGLHPNFFHKVSNHYNQSLAAERSRFGDKKFARDKTLILEKLRSLPKPQLTGWRAKLAREEAYHNSPSENSLGTQRLWNYVDTDDDTPDNDRYVLVTCRATQTNDDELTGIVARRNVSRVRKMQVGLRNNQGIKCVNVAVQVKLIEEESNFFLVPGKVSCARTTSSGNHGSLTRDSFVMKSSAIPWRFSNTSFQPFESSGMKSAIRQDRVHSNGMEETFSRDKSFRKSPLNMPLPNCETFDGFPCVDVNRPEISRRFLNPSEEGMMVHSGVTPSEKMYERNLSNRFSFCSLSSGNGSSEEPELNFSDDAYSTKENSPIDEGETDPRQAVKKHSCSSCGSRCSNSAFRPATFGSSSQRDSGFLELCSRCASHCTENSSGRSTFPPETPQCLSIGAARFRYCDGDDKNATADAFSHESYEKFIPNDGQYKKVPQYPNIPTCFDTAASKWTQYLKSSGYYQNVGAIFGDSDSSSDSDVGLICPDNTARREPCTPGKGIPIVGETGKWTPSVRLENELDDCTLQLYRYNNGSGEGDYGSYLDLESTVDEQAEEFEGFHDNRKNAVILRTQLSVRVHAIVEKLVNSSGRELRRALFSLKQIFQDDKDLVHEFVQNDGLACLIKVGSEADQNYQNYILRALGQVMLYVDGMNGVIEHNETIQWLYSLIASKYRLVVKTALKLLLVFVEYTESNCRLLINAVSTVDSDNGTLPWSNIMHLLKEKDSADMELLVYAATLMNKTLNGIPDQDTYYDVVDVLEEQGMENVIQYYMSKQGTDLDLLQQFQIYEAVMKHEDGVPDCKPLPLDARLRQVPRSRKSYPGENDRRKSRRHSVDTMGSNKQNKLNHCLEKTPEESPFIWEDNRNHKTKEGLKNNYNHDTSHLNGHNEHMSGEDENGITPALRRRRRERDARNKSFIKEQEQSHKENNNNRNSLSSMSSACSDSSSENGTLVNQEKPFQSMVEKRRSCFENNVSLQNQKNLLAKNKCDRTPEKEQGNHTIELSKSNYLPCAKSDTNKKAWMFSMMYSKSQDDENSNVVQQELIRRSLSPMNNINKFVSCNNANDENVINNLRKDRSMKDLQERYSPRHENGFKSPSPDNFSRLGDTSGIISRAKEGLVASSTRLEPRTLSPCDSPPKTSLEPKKLDNDLQWEQLMKSMKRPLVINDLDFTDLGSEEDIDFLPNGDALQEESQEANHNSQSPCVGLLPPPPPPLPMGGGPVPPPPPPQEPVKNASLFNSKPTNNSGLPSWIRRNQHQIPDSSESSKTLQKTKKTVKLFWREVKEDRSLLQKIGRKKTIWDELKPIPVDTQKLEHLFENRGKDILSKEKVQESNKKNEIIVLDTKRSNAINIGITKLPPPRTIKTAIFKMDNTIMNREGIEKILAMLPTEDEKSRISEAQMTNPDVPLGSAEQFLLTLSSISELEARLRLWAFRLDYESIEREVAEPLMDLKQAINEIEGSETFRVILSTLRSIGNFLNGAEIKGFHIEYLSKVPEVKDTVHKHSLLHHVCHLVMEKFPKSNDLYSEIGAVTRASKVDYTEVSRSLNKMENECKASWDYLKAIAKHDCSVTMKVRTSEFLTDCAERIIVLKVIHRRMMNRYRKFLVYLGCASNNKDDLKEDLCVQNVCKVLSEFALEYRTTRERVLQQIEKKANHRERNKTRGKMITDMEKFRTKEQQADHELRQLLGNGAIITDDQRMQKWGTVPGIRGRIKANSGPGGSLGRHSAPTKDDGLTDGDDEILETLVKTATTQPSKNEPRIRKKARYGDRKSLRRTLKNGLSEEERRMLSKITA